MTELHSNHPQLAHVIAGERVYLHGSLIFSVILHLSVLSLFAGGYRSGAPGRGGSYGEARFAVTFETGLGERSSSAVRKDRGAVAAPLPERPEVSLAERAPARKAISKSEPVHPGEARRVQAAPPSGTSAAAGAPGLIRSSASKGEGAGEDGERVVEASLLGISPVYPRIARRHRQEGRVVLRVTIDSAGEISAIELVSSSGHASLDSAARAALEKADFSPAAVGRSATASVKIIAFRFELQD